MKLIKRGFASQPIGSMTLWLIPTLSYVLQKVGGVTFHKEWIWWVVIPVMFLIWALINWKIKK